MIILNNMYTGRYITEAGKLGHEIINLFKADDGKFYIWLNSMGICTRPNVDNSTIIMVRSINSKLYKVLAKAEGCQLCEGAGISRRRHANDDTCKDRYEKQNNLHVTYNGKSPEDIFNEKDMIATFWTEKTYEPAGNVYITNDLQLENKQENIFYAEFKISEAMRAFFPKNDNLAKLINDKSLWKDKATEKVSERVKEFNKHLAVIKPELNIFKIIRKDKDELSFSNALAYFIDRGENGCLDFLKYLEVEEQFLDDKYEILREKNDIDISFFGEKHVVIIENKIDADITINKRTTLNSQISKAVDTYIEDKDKKSDARSVIEEIMDENKIISQLSKYYIFALAYLISQGVEKDNLKNGIKCFLLVPYYSGKHFTKKYLDNFMCGDNYTLITYKKIIEYFWMKHSCDHYLTEFLSAMKPLTREIDNEIEEDLKCRFFEKICLV